MSVLCPHAVTYLINYELSVYHLPCIHHGHHVLLAIGHEQQYFTYTVTGVRNAGVYVTYNILVTA